MRRRVPWRVQRRDVRSAVRHPSVTNTIEQRLALIGDDGREDLRKILFGLGILLGIYLIIRAILGPFVIDFANPATYEKDWGGPSLIGVLVVHGGLGILSAVLIGWWVLRRRRNADREGLVDIKA